MSDLPLVKHCLNAKKNTPGNAIALTQNDADYQLSMLNERDTTFVLISRAPLPKLEAEFLTDTYSLLDMTPYGRQEDFEDLPSRYPQKLTYG